MGFGHKKISMNFYKIKKSSKHLEIQYNYYLLKLIHSVYNNIKSRKKFNKISNKESMLGK